MFSLLEHGSNSSYRETYRLTLLFHFITGLRDFGHHAIMVDFPIDFRIEFRVRFLKVLKIEL
jgi:hypothetical protein